MLGAGLADDPGSPLRLHRGDVGHQLPEVVVVAALELVLDHHHVPGLVFGYEVDAEVTGGALTFDVVDGEVEDFAESVRMELEPRGEVKRLVRPHLSQRHAPQPSDRRHPCRHGFQTNSLRPRPETTEARRPTPPSARPDGSGTFAPLCRRLRGFLMRSWMKASCMMVISAWALLLPLSASASETVFENFSHGFTAPAQHPRSLHLDNQTVLQMKWTGWGNSVTYGTGVLPLSNCRPNCAAGKVTRWPAKIRLSGIKTCEGAVLYYTHLYLELPSRAKVGPIKETVTCAQALPHGAV